MRRIWPFPELWKILLSAEYRAKNTDEVSRLEYLTRFNQAALHGNKTDFRSRNFQLIKKIANLRHDPRFAGADGVCF